MASPSHDAAGGHQPEAVVTSRTTAAEGLLRCSGKTAAQGLQRNSDVREAVYTGAAHEMTKTENCSCLVGVHCEAKSRLSLLSYRPNMLGKSRLAVGMEQKSCDGLRPRMLKSGYPVPSDP